MGESSHSTSESPNLSVSEVFNLIKLPNHDTIILILLGRLQKLSDFARGPFVMNTEDEIRQAYRDYMAGKFAE
ncbi:pirin-like C-terminal cupin domain-containing protein [Bacillus sp. X1(2014)]|uniref:pirin-like C-terminal cupin domain-containing protein n=1 Tax=Bacillus sp. X1(2014) TaxID=1565991 RepID=UPI0021B4537E|nr:pirin-like C-terminal cupin domain-containing protein [Bacillus sp. X1(2014)]